MANNRMYLRCKGCGEEFFIGKRFGDGYHIGQYDQYKGVSLIDRLNKFYSDHVYCEESGLDCFELVYEDPPVPRTNADRIRAMTDEELARWIADELIEPGYYDGDQGYKLWLYWLNKEVGE